MTNKKNRQAKKRQQAAKAATNGDATTSTEQYVFHLRYRLPRMAFFIPFTNHRSSHEKEMEVEQDPVEVPNETETESAEGPAPEEEPDADKIKEQGNTAFKGGRFQEAIDQYSRAIGMSTQCHLCKHPARTQRGRTVFTPFCRLASCRTDVLDKSRCSVHGPEALQACSS